MTDAREDPGLRGQDYFGHLTPDEVVPDPWGDLEPDATDFTPEDDPDAAATERLASARDERVDG